jgi:selenide,water dikinase
MKNIKLTQYSHGSGCGCKISPKLLDDILQTENKVCYENLLVGNDTKDDAAVYDLGNGTSAISTTDFFMPIVDDPFTFGKIAATNAISDIYAMGGRPIMAISIFGWPIDKLDSATAQQVIEGGRAVCNDAGIPLAGGHSIDSPEPIFGLAVTGIIDNEDIKRNDQAEAGCQLFLTKPIGIGILSTAQKQGKTSEADMQNAIDAMCELNKIGQKIAKVEGVTALTDVTGFGLLGHLREICEGSDISAVVEFDKVPLLPNVMEYLKMGCTPGGTLRNYASYGDKIAPLSDTQRDILCDPQTSGGLLCVVKEESIAEFLEITKDAGLALEPIGKTVAKTDYYVEVI